jgi:hypothetical protein
MINCIQKMLFDMTSPIQAPGVVVRLIENAGARRWPAVFAGEIVNIACCGEARPLLGDRARPPPKHFGRARYVDGFVTGG